MPTPTSDKSRMKSSKLLIVHLSISFIFEGYLRPPPTSGFATSSSFAPRDLRRSVAADAPVAFLRNAGVFDLQRPTPVRLGSAANDDDEVDDDEAEEGKFLELGREVTQAFGPLCLVTAGYTEEYLDRVVGACEAALAAHPGDDAASAPRYLPVAILGRSDLPRTFGEVLSEIAERDCLIPADDDALLLESSAQLVGGAEGKLRYPLVLFSGFEIPQLQQSLRYIEGMAGELPAQPMCAMAVPMAMDKKVSQLLEEIEGDYHENQVKDQSLP